MPSTFGGPGAPFGYTLNLQGLIDAKNQAELEAMRQLAKDLEAYLRVTLHRWPAHDTHRMADEAFARVVADGFVNRLEFGSPAPYTYWHEVRYHAQLREALDKFGPKVQQAIFKAITARMNAGSGRP